MGDIKQISQIKLGGQLYQIKDTTYAQATSDDLGLIKIGYTPAQNSQNYAVQLNNDGQAFVNVPWDSGATYKTTLNGTLHGDPNGGDLGTWFAPATGGTSGQILKSNGTDAPTWIDFPAAGATLGGIKNGYSSDSSNNFAVNVVTTEGNTAGTAYVSIPQGAKNNIVSTSTNPMIWSGAVLKSWMDDILGVDADAVSALVNELSDDKTTTGILKALTQKANAADIITYAAGGGLTKKYIRKYYYI